MEQYTVLSRWPISQQLLLVVTVFIWPYDTFLYTYLFFCGKTAYLAEFYCLQHLALKACGTAYEIKMADITAAVIGSKSV